MVLRKNLLSGKNWKFRQAGTEKWMKALVPGCVHKDLLRNSLIPDPFFGLNEKKVWWIENEDWEYKLNFWLPTDYKLFSLCEIQFEGLDTFAEVWLNSKHVLSSNNMFIPHHINVTSVLKKGKNTLKVTFRSPYKTPLEEYNKLHYVLPANNDKGEKRVSPFARKAQYMYGWDWGPRFLTSGLWKDVHLICFDSIRFLDIHSEIKDVTEKLAYVDIHFEAENLRTGEYEFHVTCDGEKVADKQLYLEPGTVRQSIRFQIQEPEYWWPRGYGTQKLYTIECLLRSATQIHDQRIIPLGLRTISLKSFSDNGNNAFIFNVNGKDIYIRGANLIPAEYFPSDITPEKYDEIIHNALSVNMNMLRAWGGGIYEADYFYDLCDKHGIMVWQDFMFACFMYPSGETFLLNIEKEIRHHIRRLRNHPSLVLWCGNNEIQEGYHTWGWKDAPEFDSQAAWKSYKRIFHEMIPELLQHEDPARPYWPSSPSPGAEDAPNLMRGDYHYWDLVKNIQPYTVYKDNVGRFMSEFGFKAYPEIRSLLLFLDKKDLDVRSEAMEAHQGWKTGAELVEKNLQWFYPEVSGIELFTYVSQLLQADAIEFAVENQRIAKPYCMGTMYWQLNDCWPSASWSGIDYYGRWKALHYRLKTAFSDIMFNANTDNGCLKIHVVSDLPELKTVMLQFCILTFEGKVIAEENLIHDLSPDTSQLVYQQDINEFLSEDEMKTSVLIMNAFNGNHLLSHKKHFFVKPRELVLKDPQISLNIEKKFNKFFLFIKTLKLAKSIYLIHTKTDGFFSDNYFDLLPGEDKIVVFVPREHCECNLEDFGYLSLWNCF